MYASRDEVARTSDFMRENYIRLLPQIHYFLDLREGKKLSDIYLNATHVFRRGFLAGLGYHGVIMPVGSTGRCLTVPSSPCGALA